MTKCTKCKVTDVRTGHKQCSECRAKQAEAMRQFRQRHGEALAKSHKEWNWERRRAVIAKYGGKCDCCGETRIEFLVLDHKDGNGTQHRKEIGARGGAMIGWIIRNDYPQNFRVLCQNCNAALGYYGYCPHQKQKDE